MCVRILLAPATIPAKFGFPVFFVLRHVNPNVHTISCGITGFSKNPVTET
jgi:hypothetical protein